MRKFLSVVLISAASFAGGAGATFAQDGGTAASMPSGASVILDSIYAELSSCIAAGGANCEAIVADAMTELAALGVTGDLMNEAVAQVASVVMQVTNEAQGSGTLTPAAQVQLSQSLSTAASNSSDPVQRAAIETASTAVSTGNVTEANNSVVPASAG